MHNALSCYPVQGKMRPSPFAGGATKAVDQLLLGQVDWEGVGLLLVLDENLGLHGPQGCPDPARAAECSGVGDWVGGETVSSTASLVALCGRMVAAAAGQPGDRPSSPFPLVPHRSDLARGAPIN